MKFQARIAVGAVVALAVLAVLVASFVGVLTAHDGGGTGEEPPPVQPPLPGANQAPLGPSDLFVGSTTAQSGQAGNPVVGIDLTPVFSAVFVDPDATDVAVAFQIQVSTDPAFALATHWDMAAPMPMPAVPVGARSADIAYAGAPLALDTRYYWRLRFIDQAGNVGAFSDGLASFLTGDGTAIKTVAEFPYVPDAALAADFRANASAGPMASGTAFEFGRVEQARVAAEGRDGLAWAAPRSGNYAANTVTWLDSPRFDFRGVAGGLDLRFALWTHLQANHDGVKLQVSTDGAQTWADVTTASLPYNGATNQSNALSAAFGGSNACWTHTIGRPRMASVVVPLDAFSGMADVRFRWAFAADDKVHHAGVMIDEVRVTTRLIVREYRTEKMTGENTEPLFRNEGATVIGFEFENRTGHAVVVATLDLGLAMPLPRDAEAVRAIIYHDADGSGWFEGVRDGDDPPQPGWSELRLVDETALDGAVTRLNLRGRHAISIADNATVKIGVHLRNYAAPSAVATVAFVAGAAVRADTLHSLGFTKDGDVSEAVLLQANEHPECGLTCAPWHMCIVADQKWTDGDDHAANLGCKPETTTIQWTVRGPATLASQPLAERKSGTAAVQEGAVHGVTETSFSITAKAVHESASRDDTAFEGKVDLLCDGELQREVTHVCRGTVYGLHVYPVMPCHAFPCNQTLTKPPADGGVGGTPLAKLFAEPAGEAAFEPFPGAHALRKDVPATRVDPRPLCAPANTDFVANQAAINAALSAMRADGGPIAGANWDCHCVFGAVVTLCVNGRDGAAFQYRVQPAPEFPHEFPLTVSQFNSTGSDAGNVAIVRDSDLAEVPRPRTGEPSTNVFFDVDGLKVGRDVETILHGQIIYLQQFSGAQDNSSCGYVVFSACNRPIAVLKVCPLEVKTITVCFHFPENEFDDPGKDAEINEWVQNLVARTNEILHQCCIRVQAHGTITRPGVAHEFYDESPLAGNPGLDVGDPAEIDALFDARRCRDANGLNVFLTDRIFVNGTEVQGLTVYRASVGRIVVLPLRYVGSGAGDAALYAGKRLACTSILAHEIGHALGALGTSDPSAHFDGTDSAPRPNSFNPNDPTDTASPTRRVMTAGIFTQSNYCDPTHHRFSHQSFGNDPNECDNMRKNIDKLATGDWYFNK